MTQWLHHTEQGKCYVLVCMDTLITRRAEYLLNITEHGVLEKNKLLIGVENK